jgi:hypothetical protein
MTAPRNRSHRLLLLAGGVLAAALAGITPAQPPVPGAQPAASSATAHPAAAAASRSARNGAPSRSGPTWRELSAVQQQALAPLAVQWDTLNEAQKRKWIALSANFPKLSADEQAKVHSRMAEWVALSPQQRAIARLNYGETKKLAPDQKKAQWEAYLALSPEEKKQLAKSATPKPPTTAAAIRPVGRDKLAVLPKARHNPEAKSPRIAAAPNQVDNRTLLPQPIQPRPQPQAQPVPAPAGVPPQAPAPNAVPPQAGTPD